MQRDKLDADFFWIFTFDPGCLRSLLWKNTVGHPEFSLAKKKKKKEKNAGWLKLKESMNIAVSPVHSLFVKTLNECFSSIVSLRVLGERRRLWDHFRDHVRSPGPRLLQNSKDSYQIV
jgi:hypothetical protein